jgi:hypothetical protein
VGLTANRIYRPPVMTMMRSSVRPSLELDDIRRPEQWHGSPLRSTYMLPALVKAAIQS